MAVVGADVEQLRALARTLTQAADRLESTTSQVTGRLSVTSWTGPDAERYRAQWHGESTAAVRTVVTALRSAAATVQRNAGEQEAASMAGGSRAGVVPVTGGGDADHPLTDALATLLGVGAMANDVADMAGKGFEGVTKRVISGAAVVTSLTTMAEGFASGDNLQTADGVIGLGGSALGGADPALGVAASAAQLYGEMTLPTSNATSTACSTWEHTTCSARVSISSATVNARPSTTATTAPGVSPT